MNFRQPFIGDFPITQKYGELIPGVTYNNKPHTGIDYGCPQGTPILASADGVVMCADNDPRGWGKYVTILHNAEKATLYAHLSELRVYPNQKIQQGHVIGLSGNTGNSTGPHLHFEARHKWNDSKSHFNPVELPLMNYADAGNETQPTTKPEPLKGADAFHSGDILEIVCRDGAKAFFNQTFTGYSVYPIGSPFYYTGESVVRKDNGFTYMRVVPALFSVWVAVNNGDVQILDNE